MKLSVFVVARVNCVIYICCCYTLLNMKVHGTSFVLMGHLPYSVHKFSIKGVYEYDIYISVPFSHCKVWALGQQLHNQKCCIYIVALENGNMSFSFIFNIFDFDYSWNKT